MSEDQGRDSNDGVISLLAGIGVGILVGGAVALLLAPQAGQQTRAQIRESADDALGRLRESMDELRVRVEDLGNATREAISRRGSAAPGVPQGDVAGATDEGTSAA